MNRQVELVRKEALRRRAVAKLDEPRRLEHLEVAEALEAAAKALERRGHRGRRTVNGQTARK